MTARAVSVRASSLGQCTSTPVAASARAAAPSSSVTSSSARLDGVRYGGRQQRSQRRPGAGGAAQREQGVHPRARPEGRGGGRRARPDVGGVGDQRRIADAVHLEHGAEGRPGTSLGVLVQQRVRPVTSTRSEIRTPASCPAATSAAQARCSGRCCGAVAAKAGLPAASAAAGVRGRPSATASRKARSSRSGSGSSSGLPASSSGTAWAVGGIEGGECHGSAPGRRRVSGPARHASWSVAVSPGSSSPRAASCRASTAAAPQKAADGRGLRRGPRAGQYRQRVPHRQQQRRHTRTGGRRLPTTVSSSTVARSQRAGCRRPGARRRPGRCGTGSAGTKTAEQRASSEISARVAAGSLCTAMTHSSNLTTGGQGRRGYSTSDAVRERNRRDPGHFDDACGRPV